MIVLANTSNDIGNVAEMQSFTKKYCFFGLISTKRERHNIFVPFSYVTSIVCVSKTLPVPVSLYIGRIRYV
jgi:hypothetical protein